MFLSSQKKELFATEVFCVRPAGTPRRLRFRVGGNNISFLTRNFLCLLLECNFLCFGARFGGAGSPSSDIHFGQFLIVTGKKFVLGQTINHVDTSALNN